MSASPASPRAVVWPRTPSGWRRLGLVTLFATAACATWAYRTAHRGPVTVVALAAPAPVSSGPIPEARHDRRTRRLEVHGLSAVWEAPPLPIGGPTRFATAAAPPNTPAAEVERWVQRLTRDQRAETQRALARLAAYEPLIHHALRERELPADLLYLALIESSYLPGATSRAGAVGIWQFMPATARAYGLEVSDFVDERRDPVRSSYAAARHLQWLHRQFGSWHLALAAYNAGDGRVGTTLRNATGSWRGDDLLYWRMRPLLPLETQEYVPKLLAASRVAREPHRYGLDATEPAAPLRFRELSVPGGVPLADVAAAAGADAEAVRALNPHLIRGMTPPGRRWTVRVPAELEMTVAR